jgi:two-component system C4-dicarboxylate transport sensor histidine kinase DctB
MNKRFGIRIVYALALILAVAAAGYFSHSWSSQRSIARLHAEAQNRLALSKATLFAPAEKFSYLPEVVANDPLVIEALQNKNSPQRVHEANMLLDRINSSARSSVIYALDDKGLTIISSNWEESNSFIGKNYAFRPYFKDAIKGGTGRFYGMGVTSQLPGYYLSHVVQKNNAVLGVAVVKVDLSTLDEASHSGSEEVIVTDENGVIFFSSRADWKYRPLRLLSPEPEAQLKATRQYDAVLKPPLPITVEDELQDGERLVSVTQTAKDGSGEETARYLLKTATLDESHWTIGVLVSATEMDARAQRTAVISSGALALLALSFMYLQQVHHRSRERKKSLEALWCAHEALEQKHRELQRLNEDLRVTAITDPLTGAYNRRFFFESVPKIISSANRHHFPFSVITVDVDHFKRINDEYGHAAGDKVLQTLTVICKESLREADVFARFGGEEFIMALPNTVAEMAKIVAERVRVTVMSSQVDEGSTPIRITVSCGVSQYRAGESGVEEALKRADDALYAAKHGGRNQVVVR